MVVLKRGDTRHAIKAVLKDGVGNPVNLTGCTVKFVMALLGTTLVNREVHVANATGGEVWVLWVPGETDRSGDCQAEFKVIYSDGRRETFPYAGYLDIQIINTLD